MILKPVRHHSTSEFHWDPEKRTFSAEASTLRWHISWLETILGRTYDDACDLGFTLVSHQTGREVTVAIDKVDESEDCSGGWSKLELIPCEPAYRHAFRVVIFND